MQIVIITGMSGAGKSTALRFLEDFGYYCVDNLPVPLIESFVRLGGANGDYQKIALGVDIRDFQNLCLLKDVLQHLRQDEKISMNILFLDSSDTCLLKRYKESRRSHPLAVEGHIVEGIRKERDSVAFLKDMADYVITTDRLITRELRAKMEEIFLKGESYNNLFITIMSFGFKYGIPADADLVFDVRFMPNPYYYDDMRPMTGNDAPVRDFVLSKEQAQTFLEKMKDLLNFLIPNYISEGKTQLVIAIGCTGGRHRSVTIANELFRILDTMEGCGVRLDHRDISKDGKLQT